MNPILKIEKTCYSKIAINEFLKDKENLKTIEEYKELFNKLASVLYEIDSSETTNELNEKFENGILFPVYTEEHRSRKSEVLVLSSNMMVGKINLNPNYKADPIYTNADVYNNLDKFKFL